MWELDWVEMWAAMWDELTENDEDVNLGSLAFGAGALGLIGLAFLIGERTDNPLLL